MPSPILARADALMRRQRQSDGDTDEIPVLTDAFDGDDIPVLLDIDEVRDEPPLPEFAAPAATTPGDFEIPETAPTEPTISAMAPVEAAPSPEPVAEDPEALLRELSGRLQQRLVAELPRLIEATLRDYLAERAMLANLPPTQQD